MGCSADAQPPRRRSERADGARLGFSDPSQVSKVQCAPYCSAGTLGRLQNKAWRWVGLMQVRPEKLAWPFLALFPAFQTEGHLGTSQQGNKPYKSPSSVL